MDDLFQLSLEELAEVRVTSASMLEEPLAEVPVPVTVITEDMIHASGARSLKDLLTKYVPGMTFVQDQNEVNVAMRGVYTSSQQKMLLLLDGHRLNSRAYSMANPDPSIGLEKIHQIEILRGPGSSLYGNVALTAVINIVTHKGDELDGGKLTVDVGNFGQRRTAWTWGRGFGTEKASAEKAGDVLLWFEGYQSDGERITIDPDRDYARNPADGPVDIRIGAFDDEPSFDLGLKASWDSGDDHWSFLANRRRSHYIEPFSGGAVTGEAYVYDEYERPGGIGPGLQSTSTHLELAWERHLSGDPENPGWTLRNTITWDSNDVEGPAVLNPASRSFVFASWRDDSFGVLNVLEHRYGRGEWLVGHQFDTFRVFDSDAPFGRDGRLGANGPFDEDNSVLPTGREDIHSLFTQVKHRLSDRWLLNLGLRYDLKQRANGREIDWVSPRFALVHQVGRRHRFKLSISSSFVDPPYWNRFSNLPSFRGSTELEPEQLNAFQLTHTAEIGDVVLTTNLFATHMDDVIFRNNMPRDDGQTFTNSGDLDVMGVEHEFLWAGPSTTVRFNTTLQRVFDSERVNARDDEVFNIPHRTANLIVDHRFPRLAIHFALRHLGTRLSPIHINLLGRPIPDPFPSTGVVFQDLDNRLGSVTLVDLGVRIPFGRAISGSFEVHVTNVLDKRYNQGGTTLHPYPQEGRWTVARLRLRF